MNKSKRIRIFCLPVAGIENPYQHLMIEGLNSFQKLDVSLGINNRFLGIFLTVAKYKPDYIHFDWINSYYYRRTFFLTLLGIPIFLIQIIIAKYLYKVALVWTLHNIRPHDSKHIIIHKLCRRFFAKHVKWIRVFSKDSIKRAEKELNVKDKFFVCPEGSYVSYYKNNSGKKESRKKLQIDEGAFLYLYLGYIKPYKGIEDLIKVFEELKTSSKKLIIAGNPINKEYFHEIYKDDDDIIFINRFINNDELQYFYNASDIIVLPFKKIENSGSTILAMGFKKPILAPNIGVLKDRLKHQKELLYKNNIKESFEALKKYNDRDLKEIGMENFNSLKKYKWEDFAKYFYDK
ncbi:MAG: glycosyltransferase [Flavobacteriaceae bacterium]|nr:MAG: glycosyltransferase [Flavobacteriaceae bacterium]